METSTIRIAVRDLPGFNPDRIALVLDEIRFGLREDSGETYRLHPAEKRSRPSGRTRR